MHVGVNLVDVRSYQFIDATRHPSEDIQISRLADFVEDEERYVFRDVRVHFGK